MNIGELTATLGVDDSQLLTAQQSIQRYGTVVKSMLNEASRSIERQTGLIEDLEGAITQLKEARKKAFTTEEIERYNKKIAEAEIHLKEYEQAGLPAEKQTDNITSSLKKLALRVVSVAAAWKVFKTLMESTNDTSGQFQSVIGGARAGLDYFMKSVVSADFSNLTEGMREAVKAGREYIDMMMYLADVSREYSIKEIELMTKAEEQRMIMYEGDATSMEKKVRAGEKYLDYIKQKTALEIDLAKKSYIAAAERAGKINKLTDEELEFIIRNFTEVEKLGSEYNRLSGFLMQFTDRTVESTEALDEALSKVGIDVKTMQDYRDELAALGPTAMEYGRLMTKFGRVTEEERKVLTDGLLHVLQAEKQYFIDSRFVSRMVNNMRDASLKEQAGMYDNFWKRVNAMMKNYPDLFEIKLDFKPQTDYSKLLRMFALSPMQSMSAELTNIAEKNKIFGVGLDTATVQSRVYADQISYITSVMEGLWNEGFRPGNEIFDIYASKLGVTQAELQKLLEAEKEHAQILEHKLDLMTQIGNLGEAMAELAATMVDRQISKLEEQYKKDIEGAKNNAKEKEKIEEAYIKKKNELLRKAAIAEKLGGLFSIAIDTAKGIMNAASKIATAPLIPWIATLGAVQAAIVAAQPIPTMAQGGIVPAGYPNDTYPALLTSGERVIPPGKLAERPITVVLQGNLRADMQEIWVTIEQAKELHNQTT